jgi:hypothetical protein
MGDRVHVAIAFFLALVLWHNCTKVILVGWEIRNWALGIGRVVA